MTRTTRWMSRWNHNTGPSSMITESGDWVRVDSLVGPIEMRRSDAPHVARYLHSLAKAIDETVKQDEVAP